MRFDSIQIPAFGPFTGLKLSFPKSETDLHLIYGPNEAGKSSLLRAIHHLLYGIPTRTEDNFLHPYGKLLIGASISDGEGGLSFFRKKGNSGTLLDADQNSIDEGQLKAFCGSVNDEFFTHMFGLGTDSLREGAAKLLSGEGELGTLLFSASLGGSPIDAALETLQAEADGLFAGKGRNANAIVQATKAFREYEKQARDLSTSANAWTTLQKVIKKAREEFKSREGTLKKNRQRESHLRNLIQAIPLVVELNELDGELAEITLPELPSDFPERVRTVQSELSQGQVLHDAHESTLAAKREQLKGIEPYQSLVKDAPDLDSLHQGISSHLQDLELRADKDEALHRLQQELEKHLKELGLDSVEALNALPDPSAGDVATLEECAGSLADADRALAQAMANVEQTDEELTEARTKLDALGEEEITAEILDLSDRLEEHGQNARVAASQADERKKLAAGLEQKARQLGLSDRTVDEIRSLPVPGMALLEQLRDEGKSLGEMRARAQERMDEQDEAIIGKQADMKRISGSIVIHTEEELSQVRGERDRRWAALATHLKDGTAAEPTEVERLSGDIQKSDGIVDALREHASVLGEVATLDRDLTLLQNQRAHAAEVVERIDAEKAEWKKRWEEASRIIADRSFQPAELMEWREQWESWCELDGRLTALTSKIELHERNEEALLGELRKHFDRDDGSYGVLSRRLNTTIEDAKTAKGEGKVLGESVAKLTKKKARQESARMSASESLDAVRKQWNDALAMHQLEPRTTAKAAVVILNARRRARETQRAITDVSERLQSLGEDIADFKKRLCDQRNKHQPESPEFDPRNPDLTEKRLWKALEEARSRQTKHDTLKEEITTLETELKKKQHFIEAAEEQLKDLVAEARVKAVDELSSAISQFEKRQILVERREAAHRNLVNLAGSSPVEDLIGEAESAERAELQAEVDQLAPEIETLQQGRDEARDRLNEELSKRAELEKAEGGAMEAKQKAANALAEIVTDSERFIRLHHAIAFLKAQIEAYREKSQGPMIAKTSEFFATLTNGSFEGVAGQAHDSDPNRIHLVARRRRANDQEIPEALPTSALSEGTRDQLYLALRLAAIDIHLESHAPMPLILDDILMTFDDERAKSVLRVLATLSRNTQVVVFTHHEHTLDLAKGLLADGQVQRLPAN
ncbi:AAA family ATPase [Haloferula sargassicola]|uniref:YhaN AAA domain-containing protein n=1 Tax=Haloferula sargassicola TaxID=490096 RepID=A0ABP9UT43_9BACT